MREQAEEYKSSLNYLKRQALIEIEIQEFREALGLPIGPTNQQTATGKPNEKVEMARISEESGKPLEPHLS